MGWLRCESIVAGRGSVAVADVPRGCGHGHIGACQNLLADLLPPLTLSDDLCSVVCHEGGHVQFDGLFLHALSIGGPGGSGEIGGQSGKWHKVGCGGLL